MPIPEKVPAGSFAACFPKEATTVEDFHDLVARLTIYYDQERVRCQELEDENALLHRFVQELKEGQQAASKEINKPLQGVPFDQTLSGSSNYRYSTLSGSFQGQTLEESRALTDDAQEHDFRGMELRGIFVFFPSFLGGFDDNNSVYIYLFVHMSYILVYICIYIYSDMHEHCKDISFKTWSSGSRRRESTSDPGSHVRSSVWPAVSKSMAFRLRRLP